MTTGKALPDAAWSCSLPESGSRKASTAATSTGRYSGRPPAIASAMAQVSTVATPPRGGNVPSTCARGSVLPRRIHSTRSRVAGHRGRPSPHRLASIRLFALTRASSNVAPWTETMGISPPASPARSDVQRVSPS